MVKSLKSFFWFFGIINFNVSTSLAETTVQSIRNDRVLLQSQTEDEVAPEALIYSFNSKGKPTSQLKILQKKGLQSVALIIKGQAAVGQKAGVLGKGITSQKVKTSDNSSPTEANEVTPDSSSLSAYSRRVYDSQQFTLATSTAAMEVVKQAGSLRTPVSLSGSGISAFYHYHSILTDSVSAKISAGLQQLSAKGEAGFDACSNFSSKNCTIEVSYLAVHGSLRYYLLQSKINAFLGVGGGNYLPMNVSATVLDKSQIANNQAFSAEAGIEYQINRKSFIPLIIETIQFPSSKTVKASILNIHLGYGMSF